VDIGGEALVEQLRFTTQQLIVREDSHFLRPQKTDIPKALKPQQQQLKQGTTW